MWIGTFDQGSIREKYTHLYLSWGPSLESREFRPGLVLRYDFDIIAPNPIFLNRKSDWSHVCKGGNSLFFQKSGPIQSGRNCLPHSPEEWEKVLFPVWRELFPGQPLGESSDFFDLSGDGSGGLFALKFRKTMERKLGRTFPIWPLLEHPRLGDLACFLSELDLETPWPRVFPLRRGIDPGKKLFFLPPQDGNAAWYVGLARHLSPKWDVWGLEMPGLDRRDEPGHSMERLASEYVREIVTLQPYGPCRLAGYSFGGLAAFETARQLREMGREVSFLGIIDRTRPRCGRKRLGGFLYPEGLFPPGATWRTRWVGGWDWTTRQIKLRFRLKRARHLWARGFESRDGLRIQKALALGMIAYYGPAEPYQGPLWLLRQPLRDEAGAWNFEETYGWKDYTTGPITVETIKGNHFEILNGKNLPDLSSKLSRMLDEAGRRGHEGLDRAIERESFGVYH